MTKALDLSDFSKEEIKNFLNEIRHSIDIAIFDSSNYFNLGSIIRTAHNFLVRNIFVVDNNNGYYPKATMSAKKWENIYKISNEELFENNKDKNFVAIERGPEIKSKCLYNFEWPKENTIILFGGEKFGLSQNILDKCDHIISIPVYGLLHSYNVSNCAAIVLYDFISKKYR